MKVRKRKVEPLPLPPDSPFRDEGEAAAYLRIKPATLAKYRAQGLGPAFMKPVDRVLYEVAELERWARASTRRSTTDAPEDREATASH